MTTQTLVIRARIEEIPTLALFTLDSYTRDISDFQTYKPVKYTSGFLSDLNTQITTVNDIINPLQLTAELKLITANIFKGTHDIRPLINYLEGYLEDATGLTIAPKDFGISPVRKHINNDDQEGLSSALTFLLKNISNNISQLTATGYTTTQQTQLSEIKIQLDKDNAAQNKKLTDRALLVTNNYTTINQLCTTLKGIWADGKRLYKINNKTKLNDYTNSKLIARIRHEAIHTKVAGIVTDTNNQPLQNVKLKAKAITGGRSKTVKADTNGSYGFKGLKPVLLNITVTADGKSPFLVQVTPITNQTVTLNIQVP